MTPELSHFALILAFGVALFQAAGLLLPVAGRDEGAWFARRAALLQAALVALAFAGLAVCFVGNDFSLAYVAAHSNSALPTVYRFAAVWGGHEGSMLLWLLMLAVWTAVVAGFGGRALPATLFRRVLGTMGTVSVGLMAFILFASNPFERLLPAAPDGNDLNPLLQDPGMAIHPPLLYTGYVGFSVVFAFAIAVLLEKRLDSAWVRWARPWTLVAWGFLTLGIMVGSYWAYYELGWGGWWFWDPVENASFMPWLVGTALIHSLAASEKKGELTAWSLLLAIVAFSLSLLGTFLVRSGVLTSVHAFATDPARGIFILILLAVYAGGSLALYGARINGLAGSGLLSPFARDGMILANNVLLAVAAASVLLGTVYPLVLDALDLGKISVGAPYFETVFVPLMVPVLLLAGAGSLAHWRPQAWRELARRLRWPALLAIAVASLLTIAFGRFAPLVGLGGGLCAWLVATSAAALLRLRRDETSGRLRWSRPTLALTAMALGHLGLAAFVFGVTAVKGFERGEELRMAPGDERTIGDYRFRMAGLEETRGPNYTSTRARIEVENGGRRWELLPEKRLYTVQGMPMTESAIDPGLARDLYVAMGEPMGVDTWGMRIQIKPFIVWIWLGCLLMAAGGFLAVRDRRYRRQQAPATTPAVALPQNLGVA